MSKKKLAENAKKATCPRGEAAVGRPVEANGNRAITPTAATIAITPPSLLGTHRRIA